ncbi:MAG: DNA methyltransferase, partial [Candidatus Hodarchaeales archaeon]
MLNKALEKRKSIIVISNMENQDINSFIVENRNTRQKSYHDTKKKIPSEKIPSEFQAKKLGKIYSLHRYWTKQPINVIEKFICLFSEPGDVILDPFCGVGSTGVAAKKHGRITLLFDLSPVAVFLASCYIQKLTDSEMMQMDLIHDNIVKQIAKEMDEKLL